MNNNLQSIIGNLEKGDKLVLGNNEKFSVDYFAFKYKNLIGNSIENIASYFGDLKFNSFKKYDSRKSKAESILFLKETFPKILFVYKDRNNFTLHFKGKNAQFLYNLLREGKIEMDIFNSASLSRIDICFDRQDQPYDKIDKFKFFTYCHKKIWSKYDRKKKVEIQSNKRGSILKIQNRRSNNFFRIYSKEKSIRFEHEISGINFLKEYELLIIKNEFDELEEKLIKLFLTKFSTLLPLGHPYLDWLNVKQRQIRKTQEIEGSIMKLHYFNKSNKNSVENYNNFLFFLELFVFLENKEEYRMCYTIYGDPNKGYDFDGPSIVDNMVFREFTFKVKEFLASTNYSQNYYQFKKILKLFEEVERNSQAKVYTDEYYKLLMTIPSAVLSQDKRKTWYVKMCVCQMICFSISTLLTFLLLYGRD